jgi:cell division protein FtsB
LINNGNKKEGIVTITARFIKYHKLLFLFIIFLLFSGYLSIFGNNGIIKRYKLESEKKLIEKQIETEQKKQDSLKQKIEDLKNSDAELEKVAREKYGMTKEGEKIIKIYIDSTK